MSKFKLSSLFKKENVVVEVPKLSDDTILRLDTVTMRFGGLYAVNEVSFDVKRGEIFGLIGPNGAGKTTIFNCITQFYQPTSGNVFYKQDGKDTVHLNKVKVSNIIDHGIIRTFQNVELIWELSVLENLMVTHTHQYKNIILGTLLRLPHTRRQDALVREKALNILAFLGLYHYKDISPYGLPYGMLKKIELARTLMVDPELIILDEPAAGLNDSETIELAATIKMIRDMYQTTIILVEHDMKLVMSISDRVSVINFGKLIALGSPQEVQASPAVRDAYLGSD
jgi:branched-chain amino acid transport system ATP-binding protein